MSRIADPLREKANLIDKIIDQPFLTYIDPVLPDGLREIADEIDQEHERRMDELREERDSYEDLVEVMDHPEKNEYLLRLIRILYYCGCKDHDRDQCAMNGADMHVELDELCYCDGLNEAVKRLGILDTQTRIKFDEVMA